MNTTNGQPQVGVMFRREFPAQSLIGWARNVETAGFDQLWVVEDCFYHGGLTQAAMALTATRSLTVGMGINPAVMRNPAALAMEYATLANAFPGRFVGGIGHGVAEWMDQIGARPTSWLTTIQETTDIVCRLLRGEDVNRPDGHLPMRDVRLEFPPSSVPPVLLGVLGPKSIGVAGMVADGLLACELSAPRYISRAREHLAAASSSRDTGTRVDVYALVALDNHRPSAAIDRMRKIISPLLSHPDRAGRFSDVPNAESLHEAMATGSQAKIELALTDELVQSISLAGSIDDIRRGIQSLHSAGADSVILVPQPEDNPDSWLSSMADLVRR